MFWRARKQFEIQGIDDDEKIGNLEKQYAEAQVIADEADKRYDEVMNLKKCLWVSCFIE